MIPVFNEDLGRDNPYILTLLYQAGAIIHRIKTNYLEILGANPDERQVRKLMAEQHRQVIADLKRGRFDKGRGGKKAEKSLEESRKRVRSRDEAWFAFTLFLATAS